MKNSVKISITDFNKLVKKEKKPNIFKKIWKFFQYNYRYNRNTFIALTSLIFIFAIGISISVYMSFARVGFNQNVVNAGDIATNPYYSKLTGIDYKDNDIYNSDTTEATSFAGGTGTESDPYIITTPGQLKYLSDSVNSDGTSEIINEEKYVRSDDETVECFPNEDSFQVDIQKTLYGVNKITFTNNSPETINHFEFDIYTNQPYSGYSVDYGITATFDVTVTNNGDGTYTVHFSSDYTMDPKATLNVTESYSITDWGNIPKDFDIINLKAASESGNVYLATGTCKTITIPVTKNYGGLDTRGVYFKLGNNIDVSGIDFKTIGEGSYAFYGNFDGQNYKIKNLNLSDDTTSSDHYLGLFGNIENATVKSINFVDATVTINGTGKVYAGIAVAKAKGSSKVYNIGVLSGKVNCLKNSSYIGYVGSIVGFMTGTTVVANSYSYANITSTSSGNSGTYFGGIVGLRDSDSKNIFSGAPVFALVYYGAMNISGSKESRFVYNGTMIKADQTPCYCYYLWRGYTNDTSATVKDTYAILKSYDDLEGGGFDAHLNNYRYITDYLVGNTTSIISNSDTGHTDISVWKIDLHRGYYPTLEKYSKNYKFDNSAITTDLSYAKANYTDKGYVKVNILNTQNSSQNTVRYIKIVGKDESTNDFTNNKIKLPFNKQHIGMTYNNDGKYRGYYMEISGWQLVSVIQNGTTYNTKLDASTFNYNYTKRSGSHSADKDIGTVYAQGGYYLVPDGVTEITVKTYWATCLYVKDRFADIVYDTDYSTSSISSNDTQADSAVYPVTQPEAVNTNGTTPDAPVYTAGGLADSLARLNNSEHTTVYDTIVMLVGNFHYNPKTNATSGAIQETSFIDSAVPFTIMSVDRDEDLVPDYAFYTRNNDIETIKSLRLDFVNFLAIPQVGTINSKLNSFELADDSVFEITETAYTDRIDIRHSGASYIKINGGFVSLSYCYDVEAKERRKNYIYFGGTAKALYVNAGVESRAASTEDLSNELPVFVVTGGRIDTLSSTYLGTDVSVSNDIFFYIDGGYINNFYTTYNATLERRATVTVNNSYINTFYSGGHADSAEIKNGVRVNISNSRIGTLYGGPEYGKITDGNILTVRNSEIDYLFGGGYGGTNTTEVNLVTNKSEDSCNNTSYFYNISSASSCTASDLSNNANADSSVKTYCFGNYNEKYGILTGYYSAIYSISGCAADAYSEYYSSLSAASVDNVVIDIKDSTINKDFYGGGNKGIIENDVVVKMYDTTVNGSLYGAGLSNENETVDVYENANAAAPSFISYTVDSQSAYPKKVTYTWSDLESLKNAKIDTSSSKLIYSPNVSTLGNVKGDVVLDIKNSTIKKNVYGGGNKSQVLGNVYVNLLGDNTVNGSVYGGGNEADIQGNVDLRVRGLTGDSVFAGCNEAAVGGEAIVTIYENSTIKNVYGGGNKADSDSTKVYLTGGEIENVYGGSNSDGTVSESNVYVGKWNENEEYYGEDTEESLYHSYEFVYGSTTSATSESDMPECVDTYIKYVINPNYTNGLSSVALSITNNTTRDFVKWEAEMTIDNMVGANPGWSGYTVSYDLSSKTITISNESQDHSSSSTPIKAGETLDVITLSSGFWQLPVTLSNGDTIPNVTSVVIRGYDEYGNVYYSGPCQSADDEGGNQEKQEIKYVHDTDFDIPADNTDQLVTATNIYGGNNQGGKTEITNVYLLKGTVTNVYGGGNEASSGYTNVYLNDVVTIPGDIYGGGNNGVVENDTLISCPSCTVNGSIFGGGNGASAIVLGETYVNISGNAIIGEDVFGSGNKAASGNNSNKANTHVNIAGGTIGGSVYGGAKTSIVTGNTYVNIGYDDKDMVKTDISIGGTVFGGGDSKESSLEYNYDFISVEGSINIVVEPMDGKDISIAESIYGSGNRSSSSGNSTIILKNFGTSDNIKTLSSIQRTSKLLLENSVIELSGAKDSENNYSDSLFSLSRIKQFYLANNSTLYMREKTNSVGEIDSVLITDTGMVNANVTIDADTGSVVKNVDNRLYISPNRNFNVTESVSLDNAEWGSVNGMTYLGIYKHLTNGGINTGIYNDSYAYGSTASNSDANSFENGVVVYGLYDVDEGYDTNGFYTTVADEDTLGITLEYITPLSVSNYYGWSIGEQSHTYQVWLQASKYATFGTSEVSLDDFYYPNTKFDIIAYNDSDLAEGVQLVDPDEIPRVADTDEDALKTFGLTMKQSVSGWKTDGETTFKTVDGKNGVVSGTKRYETANVTAAPVLDFNLTHSKNITEDKDIGTVLVSLRAFSPTDAITTTISKLYIEVIITARNYKDDYYESNITPGKQYDLFANKETKISSTSSFSVFYSLYTRKYDDETGNPKSVYKTGDYRVLLSSYRLPVNTRITMVDRTNSDNPVYYYYVVTQADDDNITTEKGTLATGVQTDYYIYKLSNFIRMGSTSPSNLFDDAEANVDNFDSSTAVSAEDYIFVVDYSEANITTNVSGAEMLIALKDSEGDTRIKIMDASHTRARYDIYTNSKAEINIDIIPDRETAYVGTELNLDTKLVLEQYSLITGSTVYDTNYIQDKMGIKLSLYGSDGTKVTGTNLLGTVFYIDDVAYSAGLDGSVRMKVSDLVTNVEKNIKVDLSKSVLPTDKYKIVVEAFGSPDGYYLGLTPASYGELEIDIINEQYGLNVEISDEEAIIDKTTGKNLNDTNESNITVKYNSRFKNPSLRYTLLRRVYDDAYSTDYVPVDITSYVTNTVTTTDEAYYYLLTDAPEEENTLTLNFKDSLKTGTYKLVVGIYSDGTLIGEDYEYIFIK